MARAVIDDWIPEETGGAVITAISQGSAVEDLARPEPMNTDVKHVPRQGSMTFGGGIGKGVAYSEDGSTADDVLLTARKLGIVVRLAEEDLADASSREAILQGKQLEWARTHAIGFDNATLGVTAAENGTTIPFTSLYRALSQSNSDTGYTGDANIIKTAGATTEDDILGAFDKVEASNYWSDADMVVIAHPFFRSVLRGLDTDVLSSRLTNGGLLDAPIRWTTGAKTNATASASPSGNPLLIVGNRNFLIKGVRSNPEYFVIPANTGAAALTDEALLKMRIRRGFAVAHEKAFAIVEVTAS
jgi:hypothetical protein